MTKQGVEFGSVNHGSRPYHMLPGDVQKILRLLPEGKIPVHTITSKTRPSIVMIWWITLPLPLSGTELKVD
jgi:hypothetical protein